MFVGALVIIRITPCFFAINSDDFLAKQENHQNKN